MRTKWTSAKICALSLLGIIVYLPILSAPYLYDDHRLINASQTVFSESANPLEGHSFQQEVLALMKQPRPLRQLSHVVDRKIFGDSPTPAHVVNILLHALVALMGYLLLRKIGISREVAWLASFIFLLLPICVESVAVVSHRKEMLAALFVLLGLRFALQGGFMAWMKAGLCFALAVAGKETAIVFPVLFVIVHVAKRHQSKQPSFVSDIRQWRTVAFLILFTLFLGIGAYLQIHTSMDYSKTGQISLDMDRPGHLPPGTGWGVTTSIAIRSFAHYLLMLVSPRGHTLKPEIPLKVGIISVEFWAALLLLVAFAAAVALTWRRRHVFCAPLLWIGASLSIVLFPPLLRTGSVAIYADRYAYLAAFGYAWLLASGFGLIRAKGHPKIARWMVFPILAIYAAGTYVNARHYSSEIALWTHVLNLNPNAYQAEYNLAFAQWKEAKNRDLALVHFHRMSSLKPGFVFGHCAFADFYAESGSISNAIGVLDACLKTRPNSARLYAQRGVYRLMEGDVDEAATNFSQAIRLGSEDPILLHNYGVAEEKRANWSHAAMLFTRAAKHPAFKQDAERITSLTGDNQNLKQRQTVRRNLVIEAITPKGVNAKETPDSWRLADTLNQHLTQHNLNSLQFYNADISGEHANDLATATAGILKKNAPFANCIILSSPRNFSSEEGSTMRLRQIAQCVLACRQNKVRPIVVCLNPPVNPADTSITTQKQTQADLNEQLHAFSQESGIVFIDLQSQTKPDVFDGGREREPQPRKSPPHRFRSRELRGLDTQLFVHRECCLAFARKPTVDEKQAFETCRQHFLSI